MASVKADPLYSKIRTDARSLLLYWAVRELGMPGTSLANRFGLSQPGVVYAVNKGEKIAKERNYSGILPRRTRSARRNY